MPLHVFERRYRMMMEHVLEQLPTKRLVATALLEEGHENDYETLQAPIHPVVCVGRVVDSLKLDDGRYNVLLRGVHRARILDEDLTGVFRCARVRPIRAVLDDFVPVAEHTMCELRSVLQAAVTAGLFERRLVEGLADTSNCCEELMDAVAFYLLPSEEPETKQRILETADLRHRSTLLVEGLHRMIEECREGRTYATLDQPWPPSGADN